MDLPKTVAAIERQHPGFDVMEIVLPIPDSFKDNLEKLDEDLAKAVDEAVGPLPMPPWLMEKN